MRSFLGRLWPRPQATRPPAGSCSPLAQVADALRARGAHDGDPAGAVLLTLPAGRLIHRDGDTDQPPALWISEAAAAPGIWAALRAAHPVTGLWPVLLAPADSDPDRPWDDGELNEPAAITDRDAAEVLHAGWRAAHDDGEHDEGAVAGAPGREAGAQPWPGLAPAGQLTTDADEHAAATAEELLEALPHLRIGLVAAARGAHVPAVLGWSGPTNQTDDLDAFSAVLRSWEDRFGARVISLGFDTLIASVAAPPSSHEHALAVAGEHLAFCEDNVWQSETPDLEVYAEGLVACPAWSFWWD